jgi:integrase
MPDVTPHALRHTAATWLMQAKIDQGEAAEYLGMSPETMRRVYAHHHPDYLLEPRQAFDRTPRERRRAGL